MGLVLGGPSTTQAPPWVSVCLAAKRVDMISVSPHLFTLWLCARGCKSGCRRFSEVSLDPRRASRVFCQHLRFSKGHTLLNLASQQPGRQSLMTTVPGP